MPVAPFRSGWTVDRATPRQLTLIDWLLAHWMRTAAKPSSAAHSRELWRRYQTDMADSDEAYSWETYRLAYSWIRRYRIMDILPQQCAEDVTHTAAGKLDDPEDTSTAAALYRVVAQLLTTAARADPPDAARQFAAAASEEEDRLGGAGTHDWTIQDIIDEQEVNDQHAPKKETDSDDQPSRPPKPADTAGDH